jgi:hypothetical protein
MYVIGFCVLIFIYNETVQGRMVNEKYLDIIMKQYLCLHVLARSQKWCSFLCSETMLTGESWFHISTPHGIWTQVPCDEKQTGSLLDQWDMVRIKWDCRVCTRCLNSLWYILFNFCYPSYIYFLNDFKDTCITIICDNSDRGKDDIYAPHMYKSGSSMRPFTGDA